MLSISLTFDLLIEPFEPPSNSILVDIKPILRENYRIFVKFDLVDFKAFLRESFESLQLSISRSIFLLKSGFYNFLSNHRFIQKVRNPSRNLVIAVVRFIRHDLHFQSNNEISPRLFLLTSPIGFHLYLVSSRDLYLLPIIFSKY